MLVLCYHAVSPTWPAVLSTTPERFAEQLDHLAARGYRGVTFSEAVDEPSGRAVAVTFDDAFRSVAALAKPVLDRLGWPATMFVPTDFPGRDGPLKWPGIDEWLGGPYEQELAPLDWDELRALREAGWQLGSHTCSHPELTRIGDDELRRELVASREACERELGPCDAIAYPYGDVDARVVAAAGEAGYRTGAALPKYPHDDRPMEWPRVGVYHPDDLRRFRIKTSRAGRALRRVLRR